MFNPHTEFMSATAETDYLLGRGQYERQRKIWKFWTFETVRGHQGHQRCRQPIEHILIHFDKNYMRLSSTVFEL